MSQNTSIHRPPTQEHGAPYSAERVKAGMKSDVTVLGAGVAGLAAAADLARQGWRVTVLEARDRVGGRILSTQPPGWNRPVELGAEFVHGGNRALRSILKRGHLRTKPVDATMWWFEAGVLRPVPDFWTRIGRVADRIPARDRGWSFAEFLRRCGRTSPAEDHVMAAHYVGSFNAGPVTRISAHALRADRAGADHEDLILAGRYDAVVRELRQECTRRRVRFCLCAIVTSVRWRRGAVSVRVRANRKEGPVLHSARAAVITLPLGVLKAGHVIFSPPLKAKQALIAKLGCGHAMRIVIRFRPGFWSARFLPPALRARNGAAFGFINAPGEAVPVWWAMHPPAAILTGWAGGDAGERAARLSPQGLLADAVRSLAHIFSTTQKELRGWIADWCTHNWSKDPYARGAYSFPVAGYDQGPALLARPVAATLFFAGEAMAEEIGTVHGAIESGQRAAQELGELL